MSVKDKKADGQPQEVEKMLDRMVSNRPAKIEEQPDLNKLVLSQHKEAAPAVQKHAYVHRCRLGRFG